MLLVISCGRVCIVNGIDTIICACRQEAGRKEGGSMGQASKARPWQKLDRIANRDLLPNHYQFRLPSSPERKCFVRSTDIR